MTNELNDELAKNGLEAQTFTLRNKRSALDEELMAKLPEAYPIAKKALLVSEMIQQILRGAIDRSADVKEVTDPDTGEAWYEMEVTLLVPKDASPLAEAA